MRYEEPRMEVLELEAEDVVTLSNAGVNNETDDNNSVDTSGRW